MQQGLLITRLTDTSGQPPDPRSHQQAVDNLLSTGLLLPDKDFRKGTVYRLFGKNNPAATEVAWMTPTNEVDIERWVDDAPTHQRGFREAVHIILDSIGHSRNLQARMVMKGSLLLAIRHNSSRFTRDLDLSTTEQYQADMADQLLDEFEK